MSAMDLLQYPAPLPPADPQANGLPEGWTIASLGEACELNPARPAHDEVQPDAMVTFVPMPAVDASRGTIAAPSERPYHEVRRGFTAFREGDVIMAKITPCMENGKAAIARGLVGGWGFGSTEFHVMRPDGAALAEYLFYYVRQETFRTAAAEEMTGSVGQKRVPAEYMRDVPIPIPPLAEQRRIVARLEECLAHVDAARERLARVPAILKRFRQSVLAAACSGELTAEWRDGQGELQSADALLHSALRTAGMGQRGRAGRLWGAGEVPELTEEERASLPEAWTWAKVRQLGDDETETVQVGPMSMQSREFAEAGVPVLNVGCVQWGRFDESKLNYLPADRATAFQRYRIQANDVLFTRSGTVGRCAVAGDRHNGYLMTFHLLRVRSSKRKCLPRYLQLVFQGAKHIRRQTEEGAIGSTRAGFNTNLLAELDVPLPPLAEQVEIVRRVDRLFRLADAAERGAAAGSAAVDRLTQALLAKAFRGELVPTEAELARQEGRDYEPAWVLLERIKDERAVRGGTRSSSRRGTPRPQRRRQRSQPELFSGG